MWVKCNQYPPIVQALPDIMSLVFFWAVTYYIDTDGFDKIWMARPTRDMIHPFITAGRNRVQKGTVAGYRHRVRVSFN